MGARTRRTMLMTTRALLALTSTLVAHALPLNTTRVQDLWCVDFLVQPAAGPALNVTETFRGSGDARDPGWGTDMAFSGRDPSSGEVTVHTTIWDTDGDGFFMIKAGDNYCKIDSGSN